MTTIPNQETEAILEEENNSTIPHDARQGRAKLLLNLTIGVLNAYNNNDFYAQFKGLQSIHYLCFAHAKPGKADEVKAKLGELKTLMGSQSKVDGQLILMALDETTELVMKNYKDQFMQVSNYSESEFNPLEALGK